MDFALRARHGRSSEHVTVNGRVVGTVILLAHSLQARIHASNLKKIQFFLAEQQHVVIFSQEAEAVSDERLDALLAVTDVRV